ncbi:MAG: dihydroxyacetone kinase subunit DhaL [Cellulosilyticaceae bacterium]
MNQYLFDFIEEVTKVMQENKTLLSDLDRAIGDGDHGNNMVRGFDAVRSKFSKEDETTISDALKKIGMTLLGTVGGASGPLYGSAFIRASAIAKGYEELNPEMLVALLENSLNGIKERGKAIVGEKTMVDALEPAVEALKESIVSGENVLIGMEKACKAASGGVIYTKGIIAKKGRASYLGERSIGHQDPGATSMLLILQVILEVIRGK